MSNSPILGGTAAPTEAPGTDIDRLGPSDSSDTGSDIQGERPMATSPDNPAEWGGIPSDADSDSDALGTGERGAAAGRDPQPAADIMPDRIIGRDDPVGTDIDPEVRDVLDQLADDPREGYRDQPDSEQQTATDTGSRPQGTARQR
ncbi:hypothetical protein [Piscinibacter sakaiensis]|uniref:hypothetical protein n=1 Tax=Piscinibacter sakaiensis TaxID=1547922 RepID=UPI003AB0D958